MLIYTQGMYIMHAPFNPSDENRGGQTLYIPGKRFCLLLCLKHQIAICIVVFCLFLMSVIWQINTHYDISVLYTVGQILDHF